MSRLNSIRQIALGTVMAAGLAMSTTLVGAAQDEETPGASHPIHIHAGTCEDLDPNPLAPLDNLTPRLNEDEEDNTAVGALTAATVTYTSGDDLEVAWEDMLAESHAINVHLSDEEVQTYIACGDIGGIVVDEQLVIGLSPVDDSGYAGVVVLAQDDDGNVDVTSAFVFSPAEAVPAPEATPAG